MTNERNTAGIGNTLAPYGFTSTITAYVPRGNSEYNGLAVEVTKRFTAHNLFKGSYTWSHLMDDSTAEVNSTTLSPRRPQDFNNIRGEWASSALDRRQRFTFTWLYEAPWFQQDKSWIKRNILGNYQIAGTYTVESPRIRHAAERRRFQPERRRRRRPRDRQSQRRPGTSSDVTALKNSAGATVGYLAEQSQRAVHPRAGRRSRQLRPQHPRHPRHQQLGLHRLQESGIQRTHEAPVARRSVQRVQSSPVHSGKININITNRSGVTNYLTPGNPVFGQFDQVYSSNPRTIQVAARLPS